MIESNSILSSQEHLLLLNDAIDRIVVNSGASHCWLNLMSLTRGISDRQVFKEVVDRVLSQVPSKGLPGFYRAMYLDIVTGEVKHIAEAGRLLQSMQPIDTDRMAAFHAFYWQRALIYATGRDDFVQALRNSNLPVIAHLIGQAIQKHNVVQFQPSTNSRIRRVAVVAPYLLTPAHPPTLMAIDQASLLIQDGIKVNLFSCQDSHLPESFHLLGNGSYDLGRNVDINWIASSNNEAKIYISDHRFSLVRRGVDMLKLIAEFDPDLVMIVGLHTCLSRVLYENWPVLALGVNSAPPMVPADVWLTAQQELHNKLTRVWGSDFPESMAWHHPYRVRKKLHAAKFELANFGILANSIVLISVGGGLNIKIAGMWATLISDVLRNNPEVVWLLVGGKGEMPKALIDAPQEQLRLIPHTSEIPALLACCDIYINPPIMGGGFSVAEAMAEGLPVLTYAGSDGGDKVGNEAAHTDDEYFSKLDTLIKDVNLRIEIGKRMRERFDSTLDLANSGPNLIAACEEALKRYQQRVINQ